MKEMIKTRDSQKRILGIIASVLACLALVISLVPVQAMAADGAATPGPVAIPEAVDDLVYNGEQQVGVAGGEGYELKCDEATVDEKTGSVLVKDSGTYEVTATLKTGYEWKGGGTKVETLTVKVAQADFGTTVKVIIPTQTWTGKAIEPEVTAMFGDEELKEGTDFTVEGYDNNVDEGTATVFVKGMGNFTGSQFAKFEISNTQAVYRLYNPYTGQHLYTLDENEYDELAKIGWKQEEIGWNAPITSDVPVYRLFNEYSSDHHYTTDANEVKELVALGWTDEGIAWYSEEEKTVPLYRLFNPNETIGTHHYTKDENERDTLVSLGWKDEGEAWYGK